MCQVINPKLLEFVNFSFRTCQPQNLGFSWCFATSFFASLFHFLRWTDFSHLAQCQRLPTAPGALALHRSPPRQLPTLAAVAAQGGRGRLDRLGGTECGHADGGAQSCASQPGVQPGVDDFFFTEFIYLFIYLSFIYLFIYLFIHSFIYYSYSRCFFFFICFWKCFHSIS